MTAPNGQTSISAAAIHQADHFARRLYRRASAAGPDFADVADVVENLHTVLKHLRIEVEDPDSLLNASGPQSSVYARHLTPVIEDCDFTLRQLETILEKYGGPASVDEAAGGASAAHRPRELELREKDMVSLIRNKLADQKTSIDIFLDTVQLHNPANVRQTLDNADDAQLEAIKNKVDAIAKRLYRRDGSSGGSDTEEEVWQQFSAELIQEGFSRQVLHRNKEVVRAYIRELDLHGPQSDGNPPSVSHLLRRGSAMVMVPPMTITPASYPPPGGDLNQNGIPIPGAQPSTANSGSQRYNPYIPQDAQNQQLQTRGQLQPPSLHSQTSSGRTYERSSSDEESSGDFNEAATETALISTRELLELDLQDTQLVAGMGAMHMSPHPPSLTPGYSSSLGTSPNGHYLVAPQPMRQIAGSPAPPMPPMPQEHQLSSSPQSQQLLGLAPRFVPPLSPSYSNQLSPTSSVMTPPPAYGSSPTMSILPPYATSAPTGNALVFARQFSRLEPDSRGNQIPIEAVWTKINRKLVSPVVLARAGERYEARPEFVAVLGRLSLDKINEYAMLTRAVRDRRRRYERHRGHGSMDRQPSDRKEDRETYEDRENRKRRESDSSSESDVLYDESDTSEDERSSRRRRRHHSSDGRRDHYDPKKYRGSSTSNEKNDEKKDPSRVYPVIVNPPISEKDTGGSKVSPASTVPPKSILKNRNENRVHFDKDGPREISPGGTTSSLPRTSQDHDRRRHRHHESSGKPRRHRDHDRDRDRNRDEKERKKRERLGAVGIGAAAASLLTVLTEAAAGF